MSGLSIGGSLSCTAVSLSAVAQTVQCIVNHQKELVNNWFERVVTMVTRSRKDK